MTVSQNITLKQAFSFNSQSLTSPTALVSLFIREAKCFHGVVGSVFRFSFHVESIETNLYRGLLGAQSQTRADVQNPARLDNRNLFRSPWQEDCCKEKPSTFVGCPVSASLTTRSDIERSISDDQRYDCGQPFRPCGVAPSISCVGIHHNRGECPIRTMVTSGDYSFPFGRRHVSSRTDLSFTRRGPLSYRHRPR